MTTRVRKDAMRLLRAVNEHQAKDREGAEVVPYEVASYAELDPTSAYYDAALDYLTTEGALVPHESVGSGAAYRITRKGLDMLEG